LLLLILGGGVFLYLRRSGSREAAKYRIQAVDRGDVVMTVTATGTISAVTTVQIGSQVSGIVASLHADFNSPVKAGQLLAELDPTPFEAQVEQRKADLTQAEVQARNAGITASRQDRLMAEGLAPQADIDAARANADGAKAQVAQAQAALRQAQTNLRYTKIQSPIDGVVVDRKYDIGQTVAASFQAPTLFTIAQDLTKMQVLADVDQSDIGRVAVGQTARFTVDAYPEEEFRGRIAQIRLNATVNQNVITYPVILEVPNPEQKLRPQMTANVTIEVAQKKDVLRVANAALRFRPTDQPGGGDRRGGPAAGAGAGRAAAEPPAGGALAATRPDAGTAPAGAGHGRGGGLAGAAAALGAGVAEIPGAGRQTVYLDEGGRLRPVVIRVGITDGRFTEILEGTLKPGDPVVVGQATSKVDTTTRPPGGGRMF
ncbi:MAG TPA: efflux RND transporter periplasmic adaptor subunit, partial [Dongiaceae bacterium]|nr:efflux RND transporter periplasmic adaptor subunit [Dongiaceae bacterium]